MCVLGSVMPAHISLSFSSRSASGSATISFVTFLISVNWRSVRPLPFTSLPNSLLLKPGSTQSFSFVETAWIVVSAT